MRLNFVHKDNVWVTEFSVSADYNLHIEGVAEGDVRIYQSGVEGAKYALVRGATLYPSYGEVYDMDFSALLYPKYIRVECATEPTMAEVTSEGEVIQIEIPVEPEEPESDVIEYHFEIPNMEESTDFIGQPMFSGSVEGNFADIRHSINEMAKKYGSYDETQDSFSIEDETYFNITVNGYKVEYIYCYPSMGIITFGFPSLGQLDGGDVQAYLNDTSLRTDALPSPYKPEIEYHFEAEMAENGDPFRPELGDWLEGFTHSDFSEIFDKLRNFAIENGNESDGAIEVDTDTFLSGTSITLNGDRVERIIVLEENIMMYTSEPYPTIFDANAVLTKEHLEVYGVI